MAKVLLMLGVLFLNSYCIKSNPVMPDYEDDDCVLDHDGTNAVLEKCLDQGEQFIRDYLRHMDRGKIVEFNTCHSFKGFGYCIQDLWKRCPTIQQVTYKHWKPVVDLMTCSCNSTIEKHECHHARQCLEAEFTGVLVKRCDELYTFNVAQKTRDKCVFLRENILCKTSLVQSACGDSVGEAAYSMSKINDRRTIEKSRCYITLEDPYDGFKYTSQCPRDFKDEVGECYAKYLHPFRGSFEKNNDLVVSSNLKELKDMCSGWREYKQCTRDVRTDCKQGVEMMYEQDGDMRAVLLKLDYICKEARQDYQKNLYCLQEVVDKNYLSACNGHWIDLEPWLKNTTSHEFYCEPHKENTYGMMMTLETLRQCLEGVFTIKCNSLTGSMMSELIRRAFDDPFYLRKAYRADCDLHKIPSSLKRSHTTLRTRHGHQRPHRPHEPYITPDHVINIDQPMVGSDTPSNDISSRAKQDTSREHKSQDNLRSGTNQLTHSFVFVIHTSIVAFVLTFRFDIQHVLR